MNGIRFLITFLHAKAKFFLEGFPFYHTTDVILKNKINNARKHNKNPINDYPYLTEK